MAGYTPVFDTVFNGTLCGKWPVLPVWLTLLPLADWQGHIDMTPEAIAARTGWPLELLKQGIVELLKPDPHSRTKSEEGRRLVPLDPDRNWGWRVVNIQVYRSKASGRNQVEDGRNAQKVRRYKKRHQGTPPDTSGHQGTPPDTSGHQGTPPDTNSYSYSYSDTDSNKKKNPDRAAEQPEPGEFVELRRDYPKRAGSQRWHDALGAYRARIREGVAPQLILAGVRRYAAFIRATGKERSEHVQQAATFLGKNRGFELPWALPAKPETAGDRLLRNINGDESKVIDHEPELFPALARG